MTDQLDAIDLFAQDENLSNDLEEGNEENEDLLLDVDPDGDDDSENPEGSDESLESTSSDGDDIESITDLSKHIGVEAKDLYALKIPMGEGIESVTLSQLKDSYQDTQRNSDQLSSDRQAFEVEKSDFKNQQRLSSQKSTDVDQRLTNAEAALSEINNTYNSLDWTRFEQEDPGNASLQKQKLQEAFNQALSQRDGVKATITAEAQQQEQVYNNEQVAYLRANIPEWNKPDIYSSEKQQIKDVLVEYGYTQSDIDSLRDGKTIRLVNDLARLKKSIRNAKPVPKSETSKVLKAGSLRRVAKSDNKDQDKLYKNAANSKDRRVKEAAIHKLLNG